MVRTFTWNCLKLINFMKALFIQPGYPDTFWSLKHALKFKKTG